MCRKDFLKWNDVVLGNCFTFNHLNATNTYKTRSSTSRGGKTKNKSDMVKIIGLKVGFKIGQEEYLSWTDTAAIMVFIHNRLDSIFSESIRYNAEPTSDVIIKPYSVPLPKNPF